MAIRTRSGCSVDLSGNRRSLTWIFFVDPFYIQRVSYEGKWWLHNALLCAHTKSSLVRFGCAFPERINSHSGESASTNCLQASRPIDKVNCDFRKGSSGFDEEHCVASFQSRTSTCILDFRLAKNSHR